MGRIRILPDHVANQIAAGEVVDRPASVAKELLENSLDAGATRIRVDVEAGGRKRIRVADNGCGMNRDDALLAFERHATSKLRTADDLLSIATLGFRGEALPSIASVARVTLETATAEADSDSGAAIARTPIARALGTRMEIAGGKILAVDDVAAPPGTTLTIEDLFFNTPARRKFLRAESTELAHVTALVTHYALAHPDKHFELYSATHTLLVAPPVARPAERIFQIFGRETLNQLLPVAAETPLARAGLPEPPPWKREPDEPRREPGLLRLSGFFSRPELQKLNRNSIYIFVNKRLIRDRLLLHAIIEAYRNVIPPTSFPVVLLFLEMPPEEVDVNVHPAKTEVRFRQQSLVHDFVRDSLRTALVKARPAAEFLAALGASAVASPTLMPPPASPLPGSPDADAEPMADSDPIGAPAAEMSGGAESFTLMPPTLPPQAVRLPFAQQNGDAANSYWAKQEGFLRQSASEEISLADPPELRSSLGQATAALAAAVDIPAETARAESERSAATLNHLASLKPLGQLRESFILAVNDEGLWIVDQHVAHERVLFEKILAARQVERVERQRLLMPVLVELQPMQMVVFSQIAEELEKNGFEVEPFGPRTLAVKSAPVGLEGRQLERMLAQVIEQTSLASADSFGEVKQNEDFMAMRTRIAASIACHAAIKVNTPLDGARIEWLLKELAKTNHPTSCPHGRPIALRYSWKEIQRAFQRI